MLIMVIFFLWFLCLTLIQMKDKKAAKVLIQRAKLNPDLYSSADILYAKKIKKNLKNWISRYIFKYTDDGQKFASRQETEELLLFEGMMQTGQATKDDYDHHPSNLAVF